MIRLHIDNQVCDASAKSLQEVMVAVSERLPADRLVAEIMRNGKRMADWNEAEMISFEGAELVVHTVSKGQWAATWMDTALSSVRRLQTSFMRAMDASFEQGAHPQRLFSTCVQGLKQFLHVVDISRGACPEFQAIAHNGISASQLHAELQRLCLQLSHLLQSQQIDEFIDRVDFALLPHLSTWNQALTTQQLTSPS